MLRKGGNDEVIRQEGVPFLISEVNRVKNKKIDAFSCNKYLLCLHHERHKGIFLTFCGSLDMVFMVSSGMGSQEKEVMMR